MSKAKIISISLFLVLFLILPASVLANGAVLGEATLSVTPNIPATAEGPGLILPDSPFFFLDQLKQNVRLFFAFSTEEKAKVHAAIAGERLAELRIMLARNNANGVRTDLTGIADNLTAAADELNQAKLTGNNLTGTAQTINSSIKRVQDALDNLSTQAKGDVKTRVIFAQSVVFDAKVQVEDQLPSDQIQNEVLDDLSRRSAEQVMQASDSATSIQNTLDQLEKQIVNSATESSAARQNAIKKAFINKNDKASQALLNQLLTQEQQREQKLLQAQSTALNAAKAAAVAAQKAAEQFQQSQNAIDDLRAQPAATMPASEK